MSVIKYINENDVVNLMEAEMERNREKNLINNPDSFIKHHKDTRKIACDIAETIIDKHPVFGDSIDSNIVGTASFLHDFTKIIEGGKYHEIGTAHIILTKGDIPVEQGGLGLIAGDSKNEKRKTLMKIASVIPTDFLSYEELGGSNFPNGALYKEVEFFLERVDYLRKNLSSTNELLTIEELTLPHTLEQKIALVADFSNLAGERVPVIKRLDELVERYRKEGTFYYNPTAARLADTAFRPRLIDAANEIGQLYGKILL